MFQQEAITGTGTMEDAASKWKVGDGSALVWTRYPAVWLYNSSTVGYLNPAAISKPAIDTR